MSDGESAPFKVSSGNLSVVKSFLVLSRTLFLDSCYFNVTEIHSLLLTISLS